MSKTATSVSNTRGRFISIEGGEGVGKSTQITALVDALRAGGIDVVKTREPGGTAGAETIRKLLLDGSDDRWNIRAEALLFAAARSDHVAHLIEPALAAGKWVVSDRFVDSSRAYQGQGSSEGALSDDDVMALHRIGSGGLLPDRTLVLTLDEAKASARAHGRDGGQGDRIQSRGSGFHGAVHAVFASFAQQDPQRVRMINANGTQADVGGRIWAQISDLLP